jgi:leucyl/phenylalanyl-tRNA---protein transferase
MMLTMLLDNMPFPPVDQALDKPNGLLAAGGDLSPERILDAYRHGIFPWFNTDEPVLWWSPDPRMVLFPQEFKLSRSLRRTLRNKQYEVRADSAFEQVMRACAAPREGQRRGWNKTAEDNSTENSRETALPAPEGSAPPCQGGTWIHEKMIAAYAVLHRLGHAHSIETWIDGELAGGLYGIAIGRMFYGESMFSRRTDASKIALAHLAKQLERWNFGMIDCQMNTHHLASLGAREIPRAEFIVRLRELIHYPDIASPWKLDHDLVE